MSYFRPQILTQMMRQQLQRSAHAHFEGVNTLADLATGHNVDVDDSLLGESDEITTATAAVGAAAAAMALMHLGRR